MRVIFQIIIIFFVIFSCEKYPSVDTVWPPDENSTAAPIITGVSPHADSAFGGFTILTISGENFSNTIRSLFNKSIIAGSPDIFMASLNVLIINPINIIIQIIIIQKIIHGHLIIIG